MKNRKTNTAKRRSFLAIALVTAILFCFIACEDDSDSSSGGGGSGGGGGGGNVNSDAFTSIDGFISWLYNQPDNTAATAYKVKLNLLSLGGGSMKEGSVGYYLKDEDFKKKFVYIDLSGSYLKTIESFGSYTGLVGVTIPNSVTKIDGGAFYGCTSLTSVTFATGSNISGYYSASTGTLPNFGNNAFPEGSDGKGGNTLQTAYNKFTGKAGTYTRAPNGDTWTKTSN